MYISVAKSSRASALTADDFIRPKMRLSELILAVSGVMILGVCCLFLLAGLIDDAEALRSMAAESSDT